MFVDIRHAIRLLVRSPLFTATAVLSLAIGVGATTTIFTLADALLLRRPVGVVEPDRVVDIGRTRNGREFDNSSYPNFQDIAAQATKLSGVFGTTSTRRRWRSAATRVPNASTRRSSAATTSRSWA